MVVVVVMVAAFVCHRGRDRKCCCGRDCSRQSCTRTRVACVFVGLGEGVGNVGAHTLKMGSRTLFRGLAGCVLFSHLVSGFIAAGL